MELLPVRDRAAADNLRYARPGVEELVGLLGALARRAPPQAGPCGRLRVQARAFRPGHQWVPGAESKRNVDTWRRVASGLAAVRRQGAVQWAESDFIFTLEGCDVVDDGGVPGLIWL